MKSKYSIITILLYSTLSILFLGCGKEDSIEDNETINVVRPSDLVADVIDPQTISLTWRDNQTGIDHYVIERSSPSGYVAISEVAGGISSFEDKDFEQLTSYTYRIKAVSKDISSEYFISNLIYTLTKEVVRIVGDSEVESNFTLNLEYDWPGNINSSGDHYILEESLNPNSGFKEIQRINASGENKRIALSREDGIYFYRAKIFHAYGYSDYGNIHKVKVKQPLATLRITNISKYQIISLVANGVEWIPRGHTVDVRQPIDLTFSSSGSVDFRIAIGWISGSHREELWVTTTTRDVRVGRTDHVSFSGPSLADILTDNQSNKNWVGTYYDANGIPHQARFQFINTGRWYLFNDNQLLNQGFIRVVDWPNYSNKITFSFGSGYQNVELSWPFSSFYYDNGPPSWRKIHYVKR